MLPESPWPRGPEDWKVLLVDDEPAVHEISRLILADLAFEGRPVALLSAASAAQAREQLARHPDIALVLLDVVMETDDAGFTLVQHIRGSLANSDMQIVLRTGQPGMAPEREVIHQYEINGYCLKTDLTAQRLHSIVVSGLRSFRHAQGLRQRVDGAARTALVGSAGAAPSTVESESALAFSSGGWLLQVQPEVELATQRVCGVELVPQWHTPAGQLLSTRACGALPAGSLRRALVLDLLAQSCSWARTWHGQGLSGLSVSIPLVADCLGDPETCIAVASLLREAALPAGTLDLLISESELLGDDPAVRSAVLMLRAQGLRFTLVEFGAQTISLQRLSQLMPDRLKIHRLFVRGAAADPSCAAMARSTIALAQTLKIVAIADGITSDADMQFFKWEACELGQGDALAPACAPADLAECLRHGRRLPH